MKFYLKAINPAIAFIVLGLCYWASASNDSEFNFLGPWAGGFATYFFAKGLFCCSTMLLLGKVLLTMLYKDESQKKSFSYVLYCIGLLGMAVGIFFWVWAVKGEENGDRTGEETVLVANPEGITIVNDYRISESEALRIGGEIQNGRETAGGSVTVRADVYIGGRFSDTCESGSFILDPGETQRFIMECADMKNSRISDSVTYDLKILAKEKIAK